MAAMLPNFNEEFHGPAPKCPLTFKGQHGIISQKTELSIDWYIYILLLLVKEDTGGIGLKSPSCQQLQFYRKM
jgi:hypothetical protein